MSRLGEKGVKIQKNWSLMVSFVRLCASTEPTTQTRKVRHQNTLWERTRSYRLISQTPAVFAACPVFKSNKNQNVFKRVSLNPKRDDLEERGNDDEKQAFFRAFYFTIFAQYSARKACTTLIKNNDTQQIVVPFALCSPAGPFSDSLSLSKNDVRELPVVFSISKRAMLNPTP